jgi:DNA-directed RNA polymerase specialized sigma24 family protein
LEFSSKASVAARDRLAAVLAPDLVDALKELVAECVAAELATLEASASRASSPAWLPLQQAADLLGCSRDAVRMRANRGRLKTRRHGRRLYVSAASVAELA